MSPENHSHDTNEVSHGKRLFIIWAIIAIPMTILMATVIGPNIFPPGNMSNAGQGQVFDMTVMGTISTPVILFVWIYILYSLKYFRNKTDEIIDGPPIRGNAKIQLTWLITTACLVLFAAGFGTYELISTNGAGGGEGPSPIWSPPGKKLQVQVIGQQWRWTYRFPQYGGVETTSLDLPNHTSIQFNVTSLDVIHSFWVNKLGVKADANPGINNVAYATTQHTGSFTVRCAELCGIWHGAMYNPGKVVTPAQFQSWIKAKEVKNANITSHLPKYSPSYNPSAQGAGGGYYGPQDPVKP